MKKLFLLLSLFGAMALTSCDLLDKDEPEYDEDLFVGELSVIPLDGGGSFTQQNIGVSVLWEPNGTITMWLLETRFVPQMPAQTMALPNITYATTPSLVSLLGDNIVPYIGNRPYYDFLITGLRGTIRRNELNVSFTCMDCNVTYIGYIYKN